MKLDLKILDSSVKHIKGKEEDLISLENKEFEVLKEEDFAFQILIKGDSPFFCTLEKSNDIHWMGLNERIRIDIDGLPKEYKMFNMNFLGYVLNDDNSIVADPILNNKSLYVEDGYQGIWVSGKVNKEFLDEEINLKVKFYYTKEYEKEKLIKEENIKIKVIDYVVKPISEGEFYLDLWQHLSNLARTYEVEYFSDKHFEIIDNYIKELSTLGQKVINLIISDYPWAGQRCYEVEENPSNLYEYNIIKVTKDNLGNIKCDFNALDRYVDLCMKYKIDKEIDIFGIIGNWDAYSFGNPIKDYHDPIRVSYYDEKEECYNYFNTKEELKEYFNIVFNHLIEKGLWDKVRIISDEPNNPELFKESVRLIESSIEGHKVNFKCAIHDQHFFDSYGENIKDLSLNTCEAINNKEKLSKIKEEVNSRGGKFTWYSCCFPEDLNIFIKSSLIESRLKGWFTYYLDFDGFLRWAYAIWPSNPFNDIRYKYPKWNAGDMFFVYPGKDLKPIRSIRWENFKFGIQDFNIFKDIEKMGISKEEILREMESLLGRKEEMEFIKERSVKLNYSKDYERYINLRNTLIKKIKIDSQKLK